MYNFSGVVYGRNLRIYLNLCGIFTLLPFDFKLFKFSARLNSFLIYLNFHIVIDLEI